MLLFYMIICWWIMIIYIILIIIYVFVIGKRIINAYLMYIFAFVILKSIINVFLINITVYARHLIMSLYAWQKNIYVYVTMIESAYPRLINVFAKIIIKKKSVYLMIIIAIVNIIIIILDHVYFMIDAENLLRNIFVKIWENILIVFQKKKFSVLYKCINIM